MKKIIFYINKVIEKICIALLNIIILGILLSVFFRYVIYLPLFWVEETSRMAFIWLVFLGSALAVGKKSHFTVTFIYDKINKFNKKIDKIMVFAKYFIIIIFMLILFWEGILFYLKTADVLSVGLGIPMNTYYLVIPISSILAFLNLLV